MSHRNHEPILSKSMLDPMRNLEKIIQSFNEKRHLTHLERAQDGRYIFPIDDDFTLRCSLHHDDVIFEATITEDAWEDAWLEKVVRINIGRQKQNRDMLSYDPKNRSIILYMRHPLRELDLQKFTHIFDEMNLSLTFWRRLKEEGNRA